ncbi:two-component system response regulator [Anaerosporomusa subterranea]|uniref:Two-component system response regulator n=1 Tax=Anaerosporomusa subterranea TaxID=1794912 RepID=A0A154BN61_ANASB|nr:response regulator transcription factor [Anaerosporomusa subterranea]KYZ75366.1 two-component system response regulator [Anaerosporomusa subterranea]
MRILVVEDDSMLREAVVALLQDEAFLVDEASAGDDGLFMAEQGIYDLLILDIMLPGMSGFEVVKAVREQGIATPILILTARDSVQDRVRGLNIGADDYLVKPFALPEFLARVKALLRRGNSGGKETGLAFADIVLDSKAKEGFVNGQPLQLTAKEYELLEFLLLNHDQILTREQIYDRIWGFASETTIGNVDLYVHYLRKKLTPHCKDALLRTVRGAGFILREK